MATAGSRFEVAEGAPSGSPEAPPANSSPKPKYPRWFERQDGLRSYSIGVVSLVATTVMASALVDHVELEDLAMLYLLGIGFVSLLCSMRVSLATAAIMILTFDYCFVPPAFSLAETQFKHALTFAVMFLVSAVVSGLQERLRQQGRRARDAAFNARMLYELEKALSSATNSEGRLEKAVGVLQRSLTARVRVILGSPLESPASIDASDLALAERAWQRQERVSERTREGLSTWLPMVGERGCLGVIGIDGPARVSERDAWWDLLETCASRIASSIESDRRAEAARRSELVAETERARSSLLSAVSHDLKTPLAAILAAGTTLLEKRAGLDDEAFEELLTAVVHETERLSRLVHNLLSMTRFESANLQLRRTAESLEEIVTVAVDRLESRSFGCPLRIDLPKDLPLVWAEPTLLEQVLVNLLENSARHAGPQSPIEVRAEQRDGELAVSVADHGPGIPPEERERVFEKFYRGRGASAGDGGIGLGLTICRSIVAAHGGRIGIRQRPGGGTLVEFTLPVVDSSTAPNSIAEDA